MSPLPQESQHSRALLPAHQLSQIPPGSPLPLHLKESLTLPDYCLRNTRYYLREPHPTQQTDHPLLYQASLPHCSHPSHPNRIDQRQTEYPQFQEYLSTQAYQENSDPEHCQESSGRCSQQLNPILSLIRNPKIHRRQKNPSRLRIRSFHQIRPSVLSSFFGFIGYISFQKVRMFQDLLILRFRNTIVHTDHRFS